MQKHWSRVASGCWSVLPDYLAVSPCGYGLLQYPMSEIDVRCSKLATDIWGTPGVSGWSECLPGWLREEHRTLLQTFPCARCTAPTKYFKFMWLNSIIVSTTLTFESAMDAKTMKTRWLIRPKRSAIRAQAVYFLHSTMPSVTFLRLSDVSVICCLTYFRLFGALFCNITVTTRQAAVWHVVTRKV